MAAKTKTWDVAAALDTPERIALYLEEAFADGDPQLISAAIGDVARHHSHGPSRVRVMGRGMTQLAQETGLAREALYRSLSEEGNPDSRRC
jgi:probable addiction module antidote protein